MNKPTHTRDAASVNAPAATSWPLTPEATTATGGNARVNAAAASGKTPRDWEREAVATGGRLGTVSGEAGLGLDVKKRLPPGNVLPKLIVWGDCGAVRLVDRNFV